MSAAHEAFKIGELARATGVSVRTLHHYDHIGLLTPSRRTESGHRLYTRSDVERLQQVLCLRQIGLPLEDVRTALERPTGSLKQVLGAHLAYLRERVEAERLLCARLEALVEHLDSAGEVSIQDLITTMEAMSVVDKYYTPEQMEKIRQQGEKIGEARIREVEGEWVELQAAIRAEMAKGTDPTSEPVRALARKWASLVREFTGGDPGVERSVQRMWQEEPTIQGIDTSEIRQMGEYVGKAMAAEKEGK
jgi:DNA-binding transcriptional MerR regulator